MQTADLERTLTELDHARLTGLLARMSADGLPPGVEDTAQELLDSVVTVPAQEIDANVVTMRTRVRLVTADGQDMAVVLSYPSESNAAAGQISVMSPLGLSLLGQRTGQSVQWQGPDRIRHEAILAGIDYQPEAAGDYGT
ncbi:enzyme-regulator fusion protein [Bordetella ansorpii]|uniref:Enzyme-regulator fusion protein n=1 Tax=Bordetella ansorpii TaxID=288768 RepID=A0A157MYG9_9BORD|nr:GreA/GreB family elongation factor [Bordetella ansorpii]SAI13786.1 enzyme-regulator fusion protein [Bordetella ansorpii]